MFVCGVLSPPISYMHTAFKLTYCYSMKNELSGRMRHHLLATTEEDVDVYCSRADYLSQLIPKPESDVT